MLSIRAERGGDLSGESERCGVAVLARLDADFAQRSVSRVLIDCLGVNVTRRFRQIRA
jgi:hypothetical protein